MDISSKLYTSIRNLHLQNPISNLIGQLVQAAMVLGINKNPNSHTDYYYVPYNWKAIR